MNIENIDQVIAAIKDGDKRAPDVGFNMGWWVIQNARDNSGRSCGTAACIGGWCNLLEGFITPETTECGVVEEAKAAAWLGIDRQRAHALFYPDESTLPEGVWYETITPAQAIAVLEHLKATKTVDWSILE